MNFAIASVAAFSFVAWAWVVPRQEAPSPPRPAAAKSSARGGEETPLMKEMEKLDDAMEFLKKSVRDATKNPESLAQVVVAEQACLAAKQLEPKMAATLPEVDRPKFVADYRKGMAALLIELAHFETALLDGNQEQARTLWKKLDDMKTEGHNNFTTGD